MPRIVPIAAVLALAIVGIATRAHDRQIRGLDYDERATVEFVEIATPEVFGEYVSLKNPREPGGIDPHAISMEDFRTFPAFYVFTRAVHVPDDHLLNLTRLRWISIIAGGLTVPLAYLLGLRFGAAAAWLTALFTLLHPALHFHAHNIRFYALLGFASTGGLAWYVWAMPALPRLLDDPNRRRLGWVLLAASGAVVGLMLTVHLGAIFPLAAMLVIAWYHLGFSRKLAWLIFFAAIFSAIPLANVGFFFYTRTFVDKSAADMINSGGPISGLAAVAFNAGFGYCVLAGWSLFALWRSESRSVIWGLAIGTFGIVAAFALKASMLRADYALGLFPLVLLASALQIIAIASASSLPRTTGLLVMALALLLVLPSFWSMFAIDGDRVDYPSAIRYIRADAGDRRSAVFAESPFAMDYLDTAPGLRPEYFPAKEAGERDLSHYERVYYVMREVKGLRTDRFAFAKFNRLDGKLVEIIGKDRLDLRVCRLYIFRAVRD